MPSLPSRRARTVNRPSIVFHSIARCPGGSISREISRHRKIPEPRARFFFLARGSVRPVGRLDPPSPFRDRPAPGRPSRHPPRPSAARARTHPIVTIFAPRGAPQRSGPSPPQSLRTRSPRAPGDARTTWVAREQSSPHTSPPRRRIESSTPTFARAHSPHDETRASSEPAPTATGTVDARVAATAAAAARASRGPSARASTGGYAGALRDDRERAPGEHVSPNARSRPLLVVVVVLRLRRRLRERVDVFARRRFRGERGVRAFAERERAEILSVHVYVVCISETVHATFRGVDGGAAEMEPVSRPGLDDSALGDALAKPLGGQHVHATRANRGDELHVMARGRGRDDVRDTRVSRFGVSTPSRRDERDELLLERARRLRRSPAAAAPADDDAHVQSREGVV